MTQHINLIDESLRQGRDWAHGMAVVGMLAVSALAVAGHWGYERWLWEQATEAAAQAEAARQANGAALEEASAKVAQVQAQLAADDEMRKAATALVDPPQNSVARLEQLVGALSPNMWLKSIEFAGARGVHIVVSSVRQTDLARYADVLSESKAFAGLPIEIMGMQRQEMQDEQRSEAGGESKPKTLPFYTFELAGEAP